MNAPADLLLLLAEWRRLTDCESRAILGEDWAGLAGHQSRKASLRQEITPALQAFRSAQPHTPNAFDREEPRLASLLSAIMAGEARNAGQLRAKCQDRQAKLERLAGTLRKLDGLRQAYGAPPPARWQSYS